MKNKTLCGAGSHLNYIASMTKSNIRLLYKEYGDIGLEDLFDDSYFIASVVAHSFRVIKECFGVPRKEEIEKFYPFMKWAHAIYEKLEKENASLFLP